MAKEYFKSQPELSEWTQSTCEVCDCMLMIYCRHLVLLECVLEKLDDPNQCVVPDHLAECSSSCCLKTKDVVFLAKKFQCTIAVADLSKLDEDWKIVRVLLQLINTLSLQSSSLKILQQIPQLLESTIGMYTVITCYSLLCHTEGS